MRSTTRATCASPARLRGLFGITSALLALALSPATASPSPLFEHLNRYSDSPPRGNGNGVVEAGEDIWHLISLTNLDDFTFEDVSATLRSVHGAIVLDGTSFFGTIPPGGTVTGDRFEFVLEAGVEPRDVLLEATFVISPFPPVARLIDVIPPGPPSNVTATGSVSSITLAWDPPADPDILGYDIHRSPAPGGPFARVNASVFTGGTTFEDAGLPPETTFYYQVVSRDRSFNASVPSAVVAATTGAAAIDEPTPVAARAAAARLLPSVPNPSRSPAVLRYAVPGEEGTARPVRLAVYDLEGRLVRVLVDAPVAAGDHAAVWDGRDSGGERLPGGIYFIELESGGHAEHGKVAMIR